MEESTIICQQRSCEDKLASESPFPSLMGALLSIPLLSGGVGALGSSLFSGCLFCMGQSGNGKRHAVLSLTFSLNRWHRRFGVLQVM